MTSAPLRSSYFNPWRPHPWHGLSPGPDVPAVVDAYVEISPFDLVKYEIDKESGYLRVDRPQRTSAQLPSLYGFVPRTFCGERVARLTEGARAGDGDPLDICILSERPIAAREILVRAKVVGGLSMLDGGEADDKIVAVLTSDLVWGAVEELADLPANLVERLRHYFSVYKLEPGKQPAPITPYGRQHAHEVIAAAVADYEQMRAKLMPALP
ncbi:MAG TPA: inorganic pyrophosphatase [Planctomycetota bacterium]|nr:inorganic pyrophosphatase [Planctomycetota bacterium]